MPGSNITSSFTSGLLANTHNGQRHRRRTPAVTLVYTRYLVTVFSIFPLYCRHRNTQWSPLRARSLWHSINKNRNTIQQVTLSILSWMYLLEDMLSSAECFLLNLQHTATWGARVQADEGSEKKIMEPGTTYVNISTKSVCSLETIPRPHIVRLLSLASLAQPEIVPRFLS